MSEVLSYLQFQEAMDAVNPKAVKKKFKNRKDKDIDNDGDVDSSDKYLHKRRKAISKAVKKDDVKEEKKCPPGQYYCEKSGKCKPNSMKEETFDEMKDPRDFVKLRYVDNTGASNDGRSSSDTKIIKKTNTKLLSKYKSKGYKVIGMGGKVSGAKRPRDRYTDEFGKPASPDYDSADKKQNFKKVMVAKKAKLGEDSQDVLKRMMQTRDNLKKQGNSAGLAAMELRIKKFRDSMSKESIDEKGPGLYANINAKRKRGEKMRKKGEKGAPSAKDFENAAKTAREERELCHSKDHDCATVVEHIVWGFGKPVYESHAIPTDDGYVAWYDVEFEHGIEREVPTEDLKIYTTEAHGMKTLNKGKKKPKSKDKAEPVKEAMPMMGGKYSDSEISRAVDIAKKMAGGNYTGAYKKIEGIKKGLAQQGKVKYALKKAAESFETWKGLSISEVNDVLVDMVSSAQDYIKLVEDGDLKSVDEPEVEIAKGMPLSFKQFQSKIGD